MANINVTNTDSDLSGKTLLTEENAYTITGLHTFDRDPNPPFAVSAGSAKVSNLDADTVDGLGATDWASYSPTVAGDLTLGNGTVTGNYMRFGDLVHFNVLLTFGSTSVFAEGANPFTISLPVTAVENSGSAYIRYQEDGGTAFVGTHIMAASTINVYVVNATQTIGQFSHATNSVPYTWESGDKVYVNGWFEAA